MLTRMALLLAAGLGLSQPALADRFYFGEPATEGRITDGTADYVDGVLIDAEDGIFTIRIVGGEIQLEEERVYKIERDSLTVKGIEARERDLTAKLARKNSSRRAFQAEEDRAYREAAKAQRERLDVRAEERVEELPAAEDKARFDPILGRVERP